MLIWIQSPFDNLPHEGFRKQRYWLMAEAFVAAGHDVVYWTTDFNHGTKSKRECGRIDSPIDIEMIAVPAYRKNVCLKRIWSHFVYARQLAKATAARLGGKAGGRPDLVISATPTLGASVVMMKAAHRVHARFVVDIQDAWPETYYRLLPKSLVWLGRLVLFGMHRAARRLYGEADHVTGVSARYQAISGRSDYYLAYHGISFSAPSRPSPLPQPSSSRLALVYVGNLGEGYGLETVIDAVAKAPDFTLDIAGRGPKEEILRAKVTALGLTERVRFHGYLPSNALGELLGRCEIGVIPMRDDSWVGLPYKLGDYLAAGLFVVSSLHGECGALLESEQAGTTYDFASADSFLAACARLRSLRAARGKTNLPEALRADRIYPAYVALLTSPARTCR